jgi:hypothetical protein
MKKLTLIICIIATQFANAQNKRIEYHLDAFSGIDCSAPLEITITKGETQSVILEVPEKFVSFFKIKVKNSILDIEFKNPKSGSVSINNYVKLKLFVTMKTLTLLDLSTATTVICKDTFSADTFKLDITGACTINLNINTKVFNADVSGASTITL